MKKINIDLNKVVICILLIIAMFVAVTEISNFVDINNTINSMMSYIKEKYPNDNFTIIETTTHFEKLHEPEIVLTLVSKNLEKEFHVNAWITESFGMSFQSRKYRLDYSQVAFSDDLYSVEMSY